MKTTFAVLLLIACYSAAFGQNKHNLYVGAGVNMLGFSAAYDRKLTRHFDMGIGLSTYNITGMPYGNIRTALYLDMRPYWKIKKRSLLFVFADVGAAYNAGRVPDSGNITRADLHTALGFGYGYMINKRGMGPYVSLGLYGYSITVHSDKAVFRAHPGASDYSVFDATSILSLGFKF